MTNYLELVILPATIAALIAYASTPFIIKIAGKIGIIDDPKKSKHPKVIHKYPVPRGGGMASFIAFLLTTLIYLPIDKHLVGILIGAFFIVLLGVLDDKYNINPYVRLALQFLIAGMPIIAGIGIAFLTNPFNGILDLSHPQIIFNLFGEERSIWILSDVFALCWIVFLMNMLNMGAKGVDGQLPGVVSIAALTIAALSLRYSADIAQWPIIILASVTAGSYLGFLPWNLFPQKIMPGYSGSTLAGYLLAILSILSTTKVGTLIVVLGIPIADTGYVVIRRIFSGKSPVWGDAEHLHHKLLAAGLSKRQVAAFYWILTATLGVIALNLNASYKLYTIIGVLLVIGGLLLWLTYRPKLSK